LREEEKSEKGLLGGKEKRFREKGKKEQVETATGSIIKNYRKTDVSKSATK
jgi:hypothetical protein